MARRLPRYACKRDGFSLVEVALAVAILSIAVTAVLGVWPAGQDQLRNAADATVTAQLAQRIAAETQQADFPDMLTLAGIGSGSETGSLPRRYFSQAGREVAQDDEDRMYEVLTRVSHRGQLPVQSAGAPTRWDAQGQLVLAIEVVVLPRGMQAAVGADGLVNRALCRRPVFAFPFVVGGNSTW